MKIESRIIFTIIFLIGLNANLVAQKRKVENTPQFEIYHGNWIDFNKNGKIDPYENPSQPGSKRIEDLIHRMDLGEKVGQLLCFKGWLMYQRKEDDIVLTGEFFKNIREYHTGSFSGVMRADAWTGINLNTGLNMELAAKTTNLIQRYVIKNSRLGIPALLMEECGHGHMAIGTTVFPAGIGLSSTWNPTLVKEMAKAVAMETRRQGAHVGFGPILDLAMDPRWSRVEETFGEDPYLSSQFGVAFVEGLQGSNLKSGINVVSTLKHFTAYGWTEGGHNSDVSHLGDFDLHDYILPPFEAAVKAGALSVMSSYNEIDGIPCTANKYLLTDVLRDNWDFSGFVISDGSAVNGLVGKVAEDRADAARKALSAGVDMDLISMAYYQNLEESVRKGKIEESVIDKALKRILTIKFKLGLFDHPFVDTTNVITASERNEHEELAREVARQSIILLKNEGNLLPLSKTLKSIAVIGPNADNIYNLLGDYTAPQNSASIVTVLEGVQQKVSEQTDVFYAKGCSIQDTSESGFHDAIEAAEKSEVVIMVMGGSSARNGSTEFDDTGAAKIQKDQKSDMECGEGYDRATLNLMGKQQKLLELIKKTGKPVVLVLIEGRPLLLNWANENIPAIVNAWYPGMKGGDAIADILFGDYNPSGRLTISIPRSVGQLPVYYNSKRSPRKNYVEIQGTALFPFGYGLSYSTFEYSNMEVLNQGSKDKIQVIVNISVKNTGEFDGEEVVQLYINDQVGSHTTPAMQLKAFKKMHLKAGEQKNVQFSLSDDGFQIYQGHDKWNVEPGKFTIMVGSSSNNIKFKKDIELD